MHPDLQTLQKRPTRRLKPLDPDQGPWLIWSHWHGAWHVQSSTGGCAGYTTDIANAGVFGWKTAVAYHDSQALKLKHIRNQAIPAQAAVKAMRARLTEMQADCTILSGKIAQLYDRMS